MSISPVVSLNLPGSSSTDFSFLNNEDEVVSSNQDLSLKGRIKSVIDRLGYKAYSVFNPPCIMPLEFAEAQYEVDKENFFAQKPSSYEEAKEKLWWSMNESQRRIIEEYAKPEFRKAKAKEYIDDSPERGFPTIERGKKDWFVLAFCEEEIYELHTKEPEHLKQYVPYDLFLLKGSNKPILDKHREQWAQLSPSEKAEKVFGKRWKYEAVAGVSAATACFFLCHYIWLYQRLQLLQQPSTF